MFTIFFFPYKQTTPLCFKLGGSNFISCFACDARAGEIKLSVMCDHSGDKLGTYITVSALSLGENIFRYFFFFF